MKNLTDFHTHILPGIDDGASNIDISIKMIEALEKQGVNNIVATPHFYLHKSSVDSFLTKREQAFSLIKENYFGKAKFILGAEVYYCSGINRIENFEDLSIGNSNYIMIELPYADKINKDIFIEIEDLMNQSGMGVVLAHIERYFDKMTFGAKRMLSKMDVKYQINLSSFVHKDRVSDIVKFINKNSNIILGSDCHNLNSRPPQKYEYGIKILGEKIDSKSLNHIIENTNKFFKEIY